MPNRILKESICTSESIDQLKPFEETMYYRLIVNCDDFGRMDARAKVLKSRLFPLKESVTLKNVEDGLRVLVSLGLVNLYSVDGKPFLFLPTWEAHQQVRAQKSKYPAPDTSCNPLISDDINGNQAISDDSKCSRNPIQSESESIHEVDSLPEAEPAPGSTVIASLPLSDGSTYGVTEKDAELWRTAYPALDISAELRQMIVWLDANPTNRKTRTGIKRFCANWLSRSQNRAPPQRTGYKQAARIPTEEDYARGFDDL